MCEKTQVHNIADHQWQLPRREVLMGLLGSLGAATSLSSMRGAAAPSESAGERFWHLVKSQFPLRAGLSLMNAANLCPSPYKVLESVFSLTRDLDADASFQNREKFSRLVEASRRALADYLGASPDEIVIPRNTSEANNIVIGGLDLGEGDDVVLWDQNHPANNVAWDVRARRFGFSVRRVTTPTRADDPEELIAPFRKAHTKRTKVLSFSHVSNISGQRLPAKRLCELARQRDIMTLIDGAQTFGSAQVDVHDLGCDFYTGSAHKWLLGPKEVGVLYVRRERIADLWPSIVGAGWPVANDHDARKLETFGQRDDAAVAAVANAVDFHLAIGKAAVESRIQRLATTLKEQLREIPGVKLRSPMAAELSGGVVVFTIAGVDLQAAYQRLYTKYQIGCAMMGGRFRGIRLCPHIYNPMNEIHRAVAAVAELAKNGTG